MVSFQCEACGDVLTKKKLDPHRGRCRGAYFTCIDCMVTFQGTDYRAHTSCMTEEQKYQGALYKEKPKKQKQQQQQQPKAADNSNAKNNDAQSSKNNKPRHPYVEDAPDADDPQSKQPPPPAPTPPPAATTEPPSTTVAAPGENKVNVFDFLVTDPTPNASRVSLGGSKEQMKMVDGAPSVFEPSKALARVDTDVDDEEKQYDIAYEENGFSYGAEPIKPSLYPNQTSNVSMDFMTPVPKKNKDKSRRKKDDGRRSPDPGEKNGMNGTTSDKKRKRGHVEELDVAAANARYEEDTPMMDAPSSVQNNAGTPTLNHSGLTGGLDRMLRDERSMSSEYEDHTNDEQDPQSPLKRTRRGEKATSNGDTGLGISMKGRAGRIISYLGGGSAVSGSSGSATEPSSKALVRTRRSSSDEGEKHGGAVMHVRRSKKTRVRHVSNGTSESHKSKRKISNGDGHYEQARRLKAIEYHPDDRDGSPGGDDDNRKIIVYRHSKLSDEELKREKASRFLSLVTKGPESQRGCSVHKVLKRLHRDWPEERDDDGRGRGRSLSDRERKYEEQKELWRTLRLKRNDRGEVVVFLAD
ncbi:hypothetical protein VTN77DRAFT_6925 [Rasamsonia byssochlamydoides]|uniref:uncharacterized protein n=1 Tax=Rasamsonia byssochlamydoides TaxID=89139 RepID=UPI0037425252